MIATLGLRISAAFRKTAPDPFVLAVLLTFLTFLLCLIFTDMGLAPGSEATGLFAEINAGVDIWATGIWNLLGFAMQMCLILVTGHALASSPPVARAIGWLAGIPNSAAPAIALVAFVAALLGTLNWGLGLIAGALLARRVGVEMSRRGIAVHYPLLAAAGYVGLLVWHGGFSGSAPLKVTTEADIIELLGADSGVEPMSLATTILSPMNLAITGGLLLIVPAILSLMSPSGDAVETVDRFIDISEAETDTQADDAGKAWLPRVLEDSPIVTFLLASLIAWWGVVYYREGGLLRLTPNTVNLTMLLLGLVLHRTPGRYIRAIEDATRGCAGIILQFPLYAGIMALMKQSGLTELLAETIAAGAGPTGLPVLTFFAAGLVNLFVPSGGGQWAVQGPVAMEAAVGAGVAPSKMVMAVAYGDQLTNMLQPFWALPLLAITGVKARDIVGYTAIVMVIAAIWMIGGLLIF